MSTRQYPCDACDYSATTSSNLSRHKAKCHPAARPASGRRVTAKRQYSPSPDNRRKCPRPPHIQLKSPDSDLIRKPFNHINRHIATTISNTVVVISSLYFVKLNIYSVINKEGVKNICLYRVFFIESSKVICCKRLKISLSHVVFGLRREVIMGHLMSDHFKMHF